VTVSRSRHPLAAKIVGSGCVRGCDGFLLDDLRDGSRSLHWWHPAERADLPGLDSDALLGLLAERLQAASLEIRDPGSSDLRAFFELPALFGSVLAVSPDVAWSDDAPAELSNLVASFVRRELDISRFWFVREDPEPWSWIVSDLWDLYLVMSALTRPRPDLRRHELLMWAELFELTEDLGGSDWDASSSIEGELDSSRWEGEVLVKSGQVEMDAAVMLAAAGHRRLAALIISCEPSLRASVVVDEQVEALVEAFSADEDVLTVAFANIEGVVSPERLDEHLRKTWSGRQKSRPEMRRLLAEVPRFELSEAERILYEELRWGVGLQRLASPLPDRSDDERWMSHLERQALRSLEMSGSRPAAPVIDLLALKGATATAFLGHLSVDEMFEVMARIERGHAGAFAFFLALLNPDAEGWLLDLAVGGQDLSRANLRGPVNNDRAAAAALTCSVALAGEALRAARASGLSDRAAEEEVMLGLDGTRRCPEGVDLLEVLADEEAELRLRHRSPLLYVLAAFDIARMVGDVDALFDAHDVFQTAPMVFEDALAHRIEVDVEEVRIVTAIAEDRVLDVRLVDENIALRRTFSDGVCRVDGDIVFEYEPTEVNLVNVWLTDRWALKLRDRIRSRSGR
jgi:hypothetical protein